VSALLFLGSEEKLSKRMHLSTRALARIFLFFRFFYKGREREINDEYEVFVNNNFPRAFVYWHSADY
jgi:hypothetical protein